MRTQGSPSKDKYFNQLESYSCGISWPMNPKFLPSWPCFPFWRISKELLELDLLTVQWQRVQILSFLPCVCNSAQNVHCATSHSFEAILAYWMCKTSYSFAVRIGTGCPGKWWSHCPWWCWTTVEIWHWGAWFSGHGGDGLALDLMILEVFSNINNCMWDHCPGR